MPVVHTTTTGPPEPSRPSETHGVGSFTLGRGTGVGRDRSRRTDERRLVLHPIAQQALGREPVERVRLGARHPLVGDVAHDVAQGIGRRQVAVDQLERLAVVGADADLQPRLGGEGVGDDAAHLEPGDLPHQLRRHARRAVSPPASISGCNARCVAGTAGTGSYGVTRRAAATVPRRATRSAPRRRRTRRRGGRARRWLPRRAVGVARRPAGGSTPTPAQGCARPAGRRAPRRRSSRGARRRRRRTRPARRPAARHRPARGGRRARRA